MQQLLIGDGNASDDDLYETPITIGEADFMAFTLANAVGIKASFDVKCGRETRRRYGTVRKDGDCAYTITMNSIGKNVGTLLHEMAHVGNDGKVIDGFRHTNSFRHQLKRLTIAYYKYMGE